MPRLRHRLDRLAPTLRPTVPRVPPGAAVILDDDDAARYAEWIGSLTADEREAVRASRRPVAVDFRLTQP